MPIRSNRHFPAPGPVAFCIAAAVLLLLALVTGFARAEKIKVREDSGQGTSVSVNREGGHVGIQVNVDQTDGDSSQAAGAEKRNRRDLESDAKDIVRVGEDIVIEAGQVVPGDVVSIGGKVTVLGRVHGDVVSVGGDIDLGSQAVVEGDAVSIGGVVHREEGAKLGGQNVGMRFIPSLVPWGGVGHHEHRARAFSGIAVFLILTSLVFLLLIGWLLYSLAETRMRNMSHYVEGHLWQSLLTGLAVLILFPVAFVLLLITVVGIPLAVLSPLALCLGHAVGFLVVSTLVGLRLSHSSGETRASALRGMIAGLIFFAGIPLIGYVLRAIGGPLNVLGLIIVVFGFGATHIAASIGLGSVILSRFGQRRVEPSMGSGLPLPAAPPA